MTDATNQNVRPGTPRKTARAFALAFSVLAAGAMGLSLALPADQSLAVFGGLLLAALSVLLASGLARRVVQRSSSSAAAALDAQRIQALLGGGLVVKLLVLAVAFLAMDLAGLKFSLLVAFALAFAGAALVLQFVVATQLARSPKLDACVSPATPR